MNQIFSVPDYLVTVNVTDAQPKFNLDYIQRLLFLVLDTDLAAGEYTYQKDVNKESTVPAAGQYIIDNYFYKESKTCDILFVGDATQIASVLSQSEKDEINDRTYTVSIDKNLVTTTAMLTSLDFDFFLGVRIYSTNVFEDASTLVDTVLLLHKSSSPDLDLENEQNAKYSSWFVNRSNFYNPVSPKPMDYIYDESNNFDDLTKSDFEVAKTNYQTSFGSYNNFSYCVTYFVNNYNDIIPYYQEVVRRQIQQTLFSWLTSLDTRNYYTQVNLDIITTRTTDVLATYSKIPFGFVNLDASFVPRIILGEVPQDDIDNGIVRVAVKLSINGIITRIIIDISTEVGSQIEAS